GRGGGAARPRAGDQGGRRARSVAAPAGLERPRADDAGAGALRPQGAAADPRSMTAATPLVHLVEPGASRAEAARAHLAARFRVVVVDARESAGAVLHALDGAGGSAFSLLATAGASRAVAALARAAGTRPPAAGVRRPA